MFSFSGTSLRRVRRLTSLAGVFLGLATVTSATPMASAACPSYVPAGSSALDVQAAYNAACAYGDSEIPGAYAYANDSASYVSHLLRAAGAHESTGFFWNQAGAWGSDARRQSPDSTVPPLHSNSWASATDLYTFLTTSGVGTALAPGSDGLVDTQAGDLIFWDWNTAGGAFDDVSMVVSGSGADPAHELVASHIPDDGSGPLLPGVARIPGLQNMRDLLDTNVGAYLHSVAAIGAAKYGTSAACPAVDSGFGGASGTCWSWRVVRIVSDTPPTGPYLHSESRGGWNPSEAPCQRCEGDPVNTATGELSEQAEDVAVPGRGPSLSLTRTYSSRAADQDGRYGYGWADGYGMRIYVDPDYPDTMAIQQENGAVVRFAQQPDGSWLPPGRVLATLQEKPDGSWVFTRNATMIFRFDVNGRLTSQSDLNGETTTFSYASGKLILVQDPAGRTLSFSYSGSRVASVSAPGGRHVTYSYDGAGNLTSVTDLNGEVTEYGYDANHRMTTMTRPEGGETTNVFDGAGRVLSQTDPNGHTMTWSYALDSELTGISTTTDAEGRVKKHTYSYGSLVSETEGFGSPLAATTTYEYDPETNFPTVIVDPRGHTVRRGYDDRGNVLRETDATGRTTTWTYGSLNQVLTMTPPATYGGKSATTTYRYDEPGYSAGGGGNLTTVSTPILDASGTQAGTQVTHYGHADPSHPGDVSSMVDPRGETWTYAYDVSGNKIRESAPETSDNSDGSGPRQNVTRWRFDPQTGWLLASLSPRYTLAHPSNLTCTPPATGCATFEYDAGGNLLKRTDATGRTATMTYDGDGNVRTSTDARGKVTEYEYDAVGRTTLTTRPDASELRTVYWPSGAVKQRRNGADDLEQFTYDALGNLASQTDAGGNTTTYQRDVAGNVVAEGAPGVSGCTAVSTMSGCTTYSYDAANRPATVDYHDPSTPNVRTEYDANGRRSALHDGTGTTTWTYDSLSRTTQQRDGSGAATTFGFDAASNVTSIGYPDRLGTVSRRFDPAGRIDAITDWHGRKTRFRYDANSSLAETQHAPSAKMEHSAGSFGTFGTTDGKLASPTGAAVDADGNVWIADSNNNRIEQFSATGTFIRAVGSYGSGDGDLSYPLDVATNTDTGAVYVADYANNRISQFTASGSFVRSFGTSGSDPGELNGPYGLAVDGDGNLWVADTWNHRVQKFSASGEFLESIGEWGTGEGQFQGPKAITILGEHVYVADTSNNRVQRFGTDGEFELQFGSYGSGDGQLDGPAGIAANPHNGQIYVTDANNGRFATYTQAGGFVGDYGSPGAGTGQLTSPKGIAFSTGGDAYVTDQGNNRVARWTEADPVVDSVTFDALDQVTSIAVEDGATNLGQFDYTRNARGMVDSVTSSGVPSDTHTYGHDDLNLLATEDLTPFAFDAGDRPTALADGTTMTYDPAGRLASASRAGATASFSFDDRGRRTSGKVPGAPSATTYEYDQAGQLMSATTDGSSVEFAYDGDGLRRSKTVGSTRSTFVWDSVSGSVPLLLTDGTTSFVYGPDGAPLAQTDRDGRTLTLHHDQLGSTRLLTDLEGSVVGTATYDAFGRRQASTGVSSALGFNGQYTDGETGLIYLRARYYDPATAQFITVDPASTATGQHYQYADGSPLDYTDPSGLCTWYQALQRSTRLGINVAIGSGVKKFTNFVSPKLTKSVSKSGRVTSNSLIRGSTGLLTQPAYDALFNSDLTLTAKVGRTVLSGTAGAAAGAATGVYITACEGWTFGVGTPICATTGVAVAAAVNGGARAILSPVSKAMGWGGL